MSEKDESDDGRIETQTPDPTEREGADDGAVPDVPRRSFLQGLATTGALGAAGSASAAGAATAESTDTNELGWEPEPVPFDMATPWTSEVDPDDVRPEYPRPQLVREEWRNLNGVWQFAGAAEGEEAPIGEDLDERILVPFPVESALSGLARHETWMWYRRQFEVPNKWLVPTAHPGKGVENNPNAQRLLVHFERVDWDATVYVNGEEVTRHKGGYDHFVADVTDALVENGPQELVIGVFDPTGNNTEPIGTQPKGRQGVGTGYGGEDTLWMTPTSGIWDTVWMEPVPETSIEDLEMTPDLDAEALQLAVEASGDDATVVAEAYDGDERVGWVTGPVGEELELPVPEPHLWSPDDPFLYDLEVELRQSRGRGRGRGRSAGGKPLDRVQSYFGMRSLGMREIGGVARPTLNGELFYPIGTLDSGQWPDGIYAHPTDEALAFELDAQKELGFNMVRKHSKVDTRRWFYHTDRLGLLVWQDMPNMEEPAFEGLETPWEMFDRDQFETELREVVTELDTHPSMAVWIPFNEGWGIPAGDVEYMSEIADKVDEWDPERLVNPLSGYNKQIGGPNRECGCGDVNDVHEYPGPIAPEPESDRISALGEFTTTSYTVEGHIWGEMSSNLSADEFVDGYVQGVRELQELVVGEGLSASVYTATTDLENVGNGLITYDRKVVKPERSDEGVRQVREAHDRLTGAAADLMANVAIDVSVPGTYPSGGLLGSTGALEITATLTNPESDPSAAAPVEDVAFDLSGLPEGWTVASASRTEVDAIENGEAVTATWEVVPSATTAGDIDVGVEIDYGVGGERFTYADEQSLSASLLAYYRFEGNFRDSSTYNNAGSPIGGASIDDEVAIEGESAVTLDGEDDVVLLAEQGQHFLADAFSQRSVSTWIDPDSTDGVQCVYNEGGIYNGFGIRIEDGSLVAGVSNNGTLETASAPFDRTEWTHVVAIFDEGALRIYVDGQQVAANEDVGFDTVPGHVGGAEIGSSTTTTPWGSEANFFGGHVDATAIFASALSEDAISTLGSLTFSVDAPASYDAGGESVPPETFELDASLSDLSTDASGAALENVSMTVTDLPAGWSTAAETATEFDAVPAGEAVTATWEVTPAPSTTAAGVTVEAEYDQDGETRQVTGGAVLSPVRIAHWPLDGTAADTSGNGHDASLENGASFDDQVAIQGSHSVALDGDDDFVDLAEGGEAFLSDSFSERSVTTWVRPESTAGSQVLYNEGAAQAGLVVRIDDGRIEAVTISSGTAVTIEAPFDATGWTHVAVVFDRGAFRLYVDGQQVAANEDVGFTTTSGGYWGGELGGAEVAYWTGNFAGHVDESAIYREALSSERIAALSDAY